MQTLDDVIANGVRQVPLPEPRKVKLVEDEDYADEKPSWYFLQPGVLLRRLCEVEASANFEGNNPEAEHAAVHDWIRSLAMELACQIDDPTEPAAREILASTKRRMRRFSHAGNASGKRGRPKTKKEDGK